MKRLPAFRLQILDPHIRAVAFACAFAFCLLSLSGCYMPRYLDSRKVREHPMATTLNLFRKSGPEVSERTWSTLRRFGLAEKYKDNCIHCCEKIRQTVSENPDAELIYALSELAYVEAKKAEANGQTSQALNHYGIALTNAYDYLFSEDLTSTRNPYDPLFRAACDLYNQSLEDALRLLCGNNRMQPGNTYRVKTENREFVVRTEMRGQWDPKEFDRYEFVSDYKIETLRNRHTTYGLGVPLIAVRKPSDSENAREGYYPKGLSYSVTALMRCVKPSQEERAGEATTCVLEFFDPLTANQIQLANDWVPLETDLTTPLAFFLDTPDFRKRNEPTEGLLDVENTIKNGGLYMLEPYDPNRIPVLMVHGLWSSPLTWMDMFNDLRSFPEIRERYQFWFYLYPSGQPFWLSATQLRRDLQKMRDVFDPGHRHAPVDQMVLVGHSMGGLISRMQTIDSGDDFWKIVSNAPVHDSNEAIRKLRGPRDAKTKLVSALFFKPNQSVKRVITIGTPHRGSDFANEYTRWLARKFIKLPKMSIAIGKTLVQENPTVFKDTQLLTVANAIDSLAPEQAIFPVMMRAKHSPGVKYHNIVGVLQHPSFLQKKLGESDGIVTAESARLEDAESELTIDAEHTTIHMTGEVIFEVRRILLEHLRTVDSRDRVAWLDGTDEEQASAAEYPPVIVEN